MADAEVNARIVFWGIEGAGTTSNLKAIHAKLRPDHRGPLEEIPTRLDPSICYERLMIELGKIAGKRTRIEICTVPGAPDQAMTRKQLLDRTDGIVLVLDARADCIDANLETFEEMRRSLAAYGRALDDVPLVVQYNKRDLADPFAMEELHRKLELPHAAVFEAIATDGVGVLQTLTTISKRVVRALRDPSRPQSEAPPTGDGAAASTPPLTEPAPVAGPEVPEPIAPPAVASPEPPLTLGDEARGTHAAEPPLDPPKTPEPFAIPADGSVEIELDGPTEIPDFPSAPGSDEVATRARSMLDASWDELAGDEAIAGETEGWCLSAVGEADLTGPRSISLPLRIVDESGRELSFRLNLSLESLEDDPNTGVIK